jgi:hypothetical protein
MTIKNKRILTDILALRLPVRIRDIYLLTNTVDDQQARFSRLTAARRALSDHTRHSV